MEFQFYELGNLNEGQVVEITLRGNSANVKLMDSSNYNSYKSGRTHRYYGGHVTSSPYKVQVPYAGYWYVTIDLAGYVGSVSSSVRVL